MSSIDSGESAGKTDINKSCSIFLYIPLIIIIISICVSLAIKFGKNLPTYFFITFYMLKYFNILNIINININAFITVIIIIISIQMSVRKVSESLKSSMAQRICMKHP